MNAPKPQTLTKKKIVIVTPAKPNTLHGNRTTALRWARHLQEAGHATEVQTEWCAGDQDIMIALHATRSHDAMVAWKKNDPVKPLVLIMTGTDLYRDLAANHEQALASLEIADQIILLQPDAIQCIPQPIWSRCRVIYQSITCGKVLPKHSNCFLVTVIGHLRDEKDPLRTAIALQHIPKEIPLQVIHLGMSMQENFSTETLKFSRQDRRYKWIGQRSHQNTLRWLASSHLMVISSIMEGGAHVVSEAIALGIPVIASDIAGNRGLLGDDYPGFFPVKDDVALAKLLIRAQSQPAYLVELTKAVRSRQELIRPEREFNAIKLLIDELSCI